MPDELDRSRELARECRTACQSAIKRNPMGETYSTIERITCKAIQAAVREVLGLVQNRPFPDDPEAMALLLQCIAEKYGVADV